MKRVCMKTAMLLVAWCCTMGAWAYDFEADGIFYAVGSTTEATATVVFGDAPYSGEVIIPSTVTHEGTTYRVTSIGEYAFYDCSNLASITLPESLTSIGEHAFSFCSSLTSIVIPEGVTSIGENAFTSCSSLASIVIPDGVTTIEYYTFGSCSGLTSITIPEGVTEIGDGAFDRCSSLQAIHSRAITPPTCGTYCFYSVDKTSCTLYVPKGTLETYKVADEWKDFVNIVEEEYTGIGEVGADSAGQAVITACGNGIVVENLPAGTAVTVYTLSGTVVYEGVANGSRAELTLPAGHLYLVKCGPTVTKVVL